MKNQFKTVAMACALLLCAQTAPMFAGPLQDAAAAYERGDYATTMRLVRPLADRGDAAAQGLLGMMYDRGEGVPVDYAKAAQWYRRAAAQGNTPAQFLLGGMYFTGKGVLKDYVRAYVWLSRAASRDSEARKLRDGLVKFMTPKQVAEAKRLSSETPEEEAKQIFERGLDMINKCVMDFYLVEIGKATTSKDFEALVQDRCGPQQRYVVTVMTQRGMEPGEPAEVAKLQKSIDDFRRAIVIKYAAMRRLLHPHASKSDLCELSEYQCAIQND